MTDTRNASLPLCSALHSSGGVCSFSGSHFLCCFLLPIGTAPGLSPHVSSEVSAGELGLVTCLRFVTASLKSAGAKQLGFNKLAISEGEKNPVLLKHFQAALWPLYFSFSN